MEDPEMGDESSRRGFLASSAAAGAGLLAARGLRAAPFKTTLHKAVIQGRPSEGSLKRVKDAGFEGIECGAWNVTPDDAKKSREVAEKVGVRIHSVMRAWVNFNTASAEGDIKSVETALRAAQGYGADAILLVPCRTGGMPIPQPWEFDIEFDEKTGHITRVVKGDNEQFKKYIEAHNHATDTSTAALKKLIPVAEETKVVIALENVWNNLWVQPAITNCFVGSFKSPWIRFYFDIGNHVKYAPPEEWVRTCGPLIVKLHAKDFKLNADGKGGNWAKIGEGSVNWPLVRQELDKLGRDLWLTNESGGLSLEELSRRFDRINAGKDPAGRDA
jgi:hexulose-6-phosphate isomerase